MTEGHVIDLSKAESLYIDLQPLRSYGQRATLLCLLIVVVECAALLLLHGVTPSPDGLFGTQSPFSLEALVDIDNAISFAIGGAFFFVVMLLLLRASLPSGYIIGALGIAMVGAIAYEVISAALGGPESWSKLIVGIYLEIPHLIVGALFILSAQSLVRSVSNNRYLCAEVTKHPLHWMSLLTVLGIPLSLINAGRRMPRALALFFCSALALGAALFCFLLFHTFSFVLLRLAIDPNIRTGTPEDSGALGDWNLVMLAVLVLLALMVPACLWLSGWLRGYARRSICVSLAELQGRDARAPLLFLRAFRDDQVRLSRARYWWIGRLLENTRQESLDVLLFEEGTRYGPVVALGSPSDPVPRYGAARGYFKAENWQDGVSALAEQSSAIVICLDDTEGIWWEIDNLLASRYFRKTLFLLHPKYAKPNMGHPILHRLSAKVADTNPELASALTFAEGTPAPLALFVSQNNLLHAAYSNTFSDAAFLLAIRSFLRDRFEAKHP